MYVYFIYCIEKFYKFVELFECIFFMKFYLLFVFGLGLKFSFNIVIVV